MSAEGSSYIKSQSPGAERLAGLTVKLFRTLGAEFEVRILFTGWSGARLDGADYANERNDIEHYARVAVEGMKEFAAEHDIDLADYTVELSRFLHHPIDTRSREFKRAGRNAFAAAWAALHGKDL